jgi:hypothetical protein
VTVSVLPSLARSAEHADLEVLWCSAVLRTLTEPFLGVHEHADRHSAGVDSSAPLRGRNALDAVPTGLGLECLDVWGVDDLEPVMDLQTV